MIVLGATGMPAEAEDATDAWEDLQVADRALYGFPMDRDSIEAARSVVNDSDEANGTFLTDEEAAVLRQRQELATTVQQVDGVRDQPWFAGITLVHTGSGIVRLSAVDTTAAAEWARRELPEVADRIDVVEAEFTISELEEGAQRAAKELPGATVSVDEFANALVIAAEDGTPEGFDPDVPWSAVPYEEERLAACLNRNDCDPYRAGIRIGTTSGDPRCTWGFRIRTTGGSTGLWTAGHCGSETATDFWYADTDSLGYEDLNLYDNPNAYKDIQRVRTNYANEPTSNDIYGRLNDIAGWEYPMQGTTVCASLGASNNWDCGTVSTASTTYTDTDGVFNYAADVNGMSIIIGDSGSPVVRNAGSYYVAVGVVGTTSGKFARVNDVASGSGWYPY